MCKFKAMGVPWPPRGWDHFKTIYNTHGQSIHKDPQNARIAGLHYDIQPMPKASDDPDDVNYFYALSIRAWEYSISNESKEYPVLSFQLQERRSAEYATSLSLSQLKVKCKSVKVTEPIADRTLMAALFFIRQIQNDRVPDWDRILKFYRLTAHESTRNKASSIQKRRSVKEIKFPNVYGMQLKQLEEKA